MDPTGYGREAGGVLGGLARLIVALRGISPHFEVEVRHVPEKPRVPCSDCGDRHLVEHGHPEHLFVTVVALTSGNYLRVRAAGICGPTSFVRKLRQWSRKAAWHEVETKPFGGYDSPHHRPEVLRRFGHHRELPATVEPGNPLTFKMAIPDVLPPGVQRGRKFRVWVGKPRKGGLVSEAIELPPLAVQEPPAPRQCHLCRHKSTRMEIRISDVRGAGGPGADGEPGIW